MKKLLLLLLFIPLVSFGQSYKDVMSISSVDMFKKVAIENGYEFTDYSVEEGVISYGYDIVKDSINGNKSSKWAFYQPKDDMFVLSFSRTNIVSSFFGSEPDNSENPYDLITDNIKEKCKYYKIQNYKGNDYVTYSCSESSYKGKIGFAISEGTGIIMHFPN